MLTERISTFVSGVRTADIPQDALDKARMGMTDFIGVAVAGSREELGRLIREYGSRMGGVAEATIIAGDQKTSPEMAALVNGTMGHALDYDDMSVSPISHPSVFLAPAILAVGETIGASGLEPLRHMSWGMKLPAVWLSRCFRVTMYRDGTAHPHSGAWGQRRRWRGC